MPSEVLDVLDTCYVNEMNTFHKRCRFIIRDWTWTPGITRCVRLFTVVSVIAAVGGSLFKRHSLSFTVNIEVPAFNKTLNRGGFLTSHTHTHTHAHTHTHTDTHTDMRYVLRDSCHVLLTPATFHTETIFCALQQNEDIVGVWIICYSGHTLTAWCLFVAPQQRAHIHTKLEFTWSEFSIGSAVRCTHS